jgi:hypothetical protein
MGDSRFARCLQGGGVAVGSGTVIISSCTISGNTASGVHTRAQNFPSAPMGKLLTRLPRFKSSHCLVGDSRFAPCLQGGGVVVFGGTVAISSCTISGNIADNVRAHVRKFPPPRWENALFTCPFRFSSLCWVLPQTTRMEYVPSAPET